MRVRGPLPEVGDRAMMLDSAAVGVVSVAICVASDRLGLMSVLVPAVLFARLIVWARLSEEERGGRMGPELAFYALCIALGAFNDWSSVVRHRIYDYGVPVYFPEWSTIPLWMLLFWGQILRSLATLARWRRLRPPAELRRDLHLGARVVRSTVGRLAVLAALVVGTRQAIYVHFADPVWSWLPFALALAVYGLALRPDRHDLRLAGLFAVAGPAIEVAYIQLGGLHSYHLGWLGGVPLWIALWWVLAVLLWKEVAGHLQRVLDRWVPGRVTVAGGQRG